MLKFFRKKKDRPGSADHERGILVFENTTTVIQAEKVLQQAGSWKIRVKGPPPGLQSGCDLVIEFPLIEKLSIIRKLSEAAIEPIQVVPVNSVLLEPVELLQVKEYGKYIMVRAANMKITVDRETHLIVNLSGGGCPDVPYLAEQMVNRSLSETPQPREMGYTLCAYALQIAFERVVELCSA